MVQKRNYIDDHKSSNNFIPEQPAELINQNTLIEQMVEYFIKRDHTCHIASIIWSILWWPQIGRNSLFTVRCNMNRLISPIFN